jgi:argininosuccinate synthase
MCVYDRVVTVIVDVDQPAIEVKMADDEGKLISDKHYTVDANNTFVTQHVFPALKANALYEDYPMGTSLARLLIAEEIVKIAMQEETTPISHGCTVKGNDQPHFDLIFRMYWFDIVAPIHEPNMIREWEID